MTHPLRAAFLGQAESCKTLGSPFMARLCRLLAARLALGLAVTDRLFAWPCNLGPGGASIPLRLAGALHAVRLANCPALAASNHRKRWTMTRFSPLSCTFWRRKGQPSSAC